MLIKPCPSINIRYRLGEFFIGLPWNILHVDLVLPFLSMKLIIFKSDQDIIPLRMIKA